MKYFIDFEFIEGFHKPLFGKRRHFIDMISIGIVCEDGREYYAISTEFNPKDANDWVKENVISKLPPKWFDRGIDGKRYNYLYTTNNGIANGIYTFCMEGETIQPMGVGNPFEPVVEFYGYYADYDWVLFCSLFGRMIDLPKGFPMYCKDLKQMLDEKLDKSTFEDYGEPIKGAGAFQNLEGKLKLTKARIDYPKQSNEHNALSDAKFNLDLYNFIQTL